MKTHLMEQLQTHVTLAQPRQALTVRTPFAGAVLGTIPAGEESDIAAAVKSAREAQPAWEARSFADRKQIFLRFHDLLLKHQDEVLDLIQLETGKARRHAFEEILDTAVVSRYYAFRAERFLRPQRRKGALPALTSTWERKVPIGVVGLIAPWNYPLNLAVSDAVPALLTGNTAVLKPDVQTSFTALWALALLREAGLPWEVFQVVTGDGPVLGPALAARADFVMFTGSTRTGRMVARQAGERLIGCSLELGGKNPMIVLEDADVETAVDGAIRGCFAGAGQVCVSIERIYVHQSIYEPFLDCFVKRARGLKLGAALDYSIDMGSLTSERQLQTVEEHVADALAKGAELQAGGRRRPDLGPLFYEPTILTGVEEDMKLFAEETFGPVVSVYGFTSEEEAIALANRSRYGLNASIWSRRTKRARRLACRLQAGSVNINEVYAATWGSTDAPTGGWKESGLRPRHGAEGIVKFTNSQTIAVQRLRPIGPSRGTDPARHARWMTRLVRLLRHTRILG